MLLQVEIMMALEEKFDIQLDEEGEFRPLSKHVMQASTACMHAM